MSTRFKPYPSYRDSGVEWLGRIPEHWQIKRLKDAVSQNPDTLPETTDPDYELQYLDIGNVEEVAGVSSLQVMRFINAPSRARRKVRSGDTIISTVRTYLKAITHFENPPENLIVSTGFAVLRPKAEVYPKFLHALVSASQFVEKVVSHSVGVGYPAINPSELSCLPVWLPPRPEQQAIASFLDLETGKIDALIKKKDRLIELLQEKRTALISHAVTQGLDPNVSTKDSGIPWLGRIPTHWDVKRLKFIKAAIKNSFVDGPFGSNLKSEHFVEHGQVFVIESEFATRCRLAREELKKITWDHFETIKRSETKPGDIIISKIGANFGLSAILPEVEGNFVVSGNSMKLTVDAETNCVRFVRWHLLQLKKAGAIDLLAGITAQPALSLQGMNTLALATPLLSEQLAIADYIDNETTKLDALMSKVQAAIERLQEYRTALISAAVTGQIDVRNESKSSSQ